MTLARAFFTGYLPFSPVKIDVEGMAQLGADAVFRSRPLARTPHILCQLERRDRAVLILLDGKRSIGEVARLVHRSELEVARTLVRLLERGYVEFSGA